MRGSWPRRSPSSQHANHEWSTRPLRPVPDRPIARRERPHRPVQLAVRASPRRRSPAAYRGHRRGALFDRARDASRGRAALARARVGPGAPRGGRGRAVPAVGAAGSVPRQGRGPDRSRSGLPLLLLPAASRGGARGAARGRPGIDLSRSLPGHPETGGGAPARERGGGGALRRAGRSGRRPVDRFRRPGAR